MVESDGFYSLIYITRHSPNKLSLCIGHNSYNIEHVIVVYLDQLLGAACTQRLVETVFPAVFQLFFLFQTFFSDFTTEIKKRL